MPAPAKAKAASATENQGMWSVLDKVAKGGPRTHTVNGEAITLKPGEQKYLPPGVAAKFLSSDSFTVRNEEGDVVSSLSKSGVNQAGQVKKFDLGPDEVVASLEELTKDALLGRAARFPGGERLSKAKREDLITFIQNARENGVGEMPASSDMSVAEGSVEVDEMDPNAVDRMFDGS